MDANNIKPKSNPKMILGWIVIILIVVGIAAAYIMFRSVDDDQSSTTKVTTLEKVKASTDITPFPNTNPGIATKVASSPAAIPKETDPAEKTEGDTGKVQKVVISNKTMAINPEVKESVMSKE